MKVITDQTYDARRTWVGMVRNPYKYSDHVVFVEAHPANESWVRLEWPIATARAIARQILADTKGMS